MLKGRKAVTGLPGDTLPAIDVATVAAELQKKLGHSPSAVVKMQVKDYYTP